MTSFRDREEVKFGHKKGMAHAMTLCLQHQRTSHMVKEEELLEKPGPSNEAEMEESTDEDEDKDVDDDEEDDDMHDFQPIEELSEFEL